VTKSTMRAAFAHASLDIKGDMGLIGGTSGERGQAQESTQGVIYKSQARGEGTRQTICSPRSGVGNSVG
jgi:hypothetical protein